VGAAATGFGYGQTTGLLINDYIFQRSIDFHLFFPNPES
jgi:hypothetical protein